MLVFVPVRQELVEVYISAADLLQRALGAKAPDVTMLLEREFTQRRPQSIAEEYLELHGYPTLRTCLKRAARRKTVPPKFQPVVVSLKELRLLLPRDSQQN